MCAQIVAPYPPPGRISVASQSGNLVSSFLNYAVPDRHRRRQGGLGGELGADRGGRLPRVLRRRSRDGRRADLPRRRARRPPAAPRHGARHGEQAAGAREGRRGRGGPARGGEPHRVARERRPRLRRHLPPGRRAARAERRARLRVGGELRDPAAAARPARRRLHHGGRLGRAGRRRLRGGGPRADRAARGSPRGDRRAGAAALEPRQPGRSRRRRDARHDSRRCST